MTLRKQLPEFVDLQIRYKKKRQLWFGVFCGINSFLSLILQKKTGDAKLAPYYKIMAY